MAYQEFLKELEKKQYSSGKINPERKTREMGKQAQAESELYHLSDEEERNLIPNF